MNTLGPGIWQEILKNVENEKCTLQNLEYGEKTLKNEENKKCTLQDMEYGEKTEKCGK